MSETPNRLTGHLGALRQRGETALGLFLTAGYPSPEATLDILLEADAGGADFIELGMPFSDPVAEGLPIQQASERALAAGMDMEGVFAIAEGFRQRSETPLLLMGYANPVLRFGVSDFCARAQSAGVDGLILPDLPPEEADELDEAAATHALTTVYLVAPNTAPSRRGSSTRSLRPDSLGPLSRTGTPPPPTSRGPARPSTPRASRCASASGSARRTTRPASAPKRTASSWGVHSSAWRTTFGPETPPIPNASRVFASGRPR